MLKKTQRLHKKSDVERVFKFGRSCSNDSFIVRFLANNSENITKRATVVVSNKVSKRANVRNKLKRRLRECLKFYWPLLKNGLDYVIIAKKESLLLQDFSLFKIKFENLLEKGKLLAND